MTKLIRLLTIIGEDEPASTSQRRDDNRDRDGDDRFGAIQSGSEESDDEDNFIVDDEDRPISKPRKRKGQHRYNDEAMQQAQDIFGVDFDFEDAENQEQEDYEEDADEDDYEEDGEEGEGRVARRKKGGRRRPARKSIYDLYEPSELEKSHLTEFDNEIKQSDLPERFLLRATPVIETSDDQVIDEESDWIYKHAFSQPTLSLQGTEEGNDARTPLAGAKDASAILKIREALKFIRSQALEVPFIAFYRKEYVHPDLNINDLWAVFKWDEKFCQLQQRKAKMVQLFKHMQQYQTDLILRDTDARLPEGTRMISDPDIDRIKDIDTFEELHDCWVHFQLYYSVDVPSMKEEMAKKERDKRREERALQRAAMSDENGDPLPPIEEEDDDITNRLASLKLRRKDPYTICKEAGLLGLASKFGMTPEQIGENMRDDYQKHDVEQCAVNPEDAAVDYTGGRFQTVENVLGATRFMVAKQISCDPLVRKCVRQSFEEYAVVHVRPTKKGLKEKMDESHPCYTRFYLKDKPLKTFVGDAFLQLLIAEQDGLLQVQICVDKTEEPDKYLKKVAALYKIVSCKNLNRTLEFSDDFLYI